MDKDSLPQWAWLLLALMAAAVFANAIALGLGISEDWQVAVVVTAMSPVLIYVGVWYEKERQHYWEQSRAKIVGDLLFLLTGAAIGSGIAIALTLDLIGNRILRDIIAMIGGFLTGWLLFWWRNPSLYRLTD
ncbi:hypothetical protein OB919_07865 [Halobacteria archaeon AArc-curdl1]|uniref:Uncharacterized protein n=1 Tax=Natronosalvus hydrolyticus TaxID=2979988 RepID=A0AAP2Z7X4_9EURY|nr:hypothetical protein [Halobacteria archaeon AArc-curdl1]